MRNVLLVAVAATGVLLAACGGGSGAQGKSYNDGFAYIEAQPQSVRGGLTP